MTLRHRLLLVYLIVVFLSVATLGVALFELNRTQNIYAPLLVWHDAFWDSQQLRDLFLAMSGPDPEKQGQFEGLLTSVGQKVGSVSDYLDVDYIRDWYIIRLRDAYRGWQESTPENRSQRAQEVNDRLDDLAEALQTVRAQLNEAVDRQRTNKWALTAGVLGLAALHLATVGWLLRRWLLRPLEQLNRQVAALGRDQPPLEPLLTTPLELANLATALDQARQSLQTYRQQLIDNERLTTIGQFAAQLAHNLRNPLASIRAAAQVAARHDRDNTYLRERMDEVVASVDRLNHWVGGLMEIARRESTPTSMADVVPVLQRISEALKPELAAKEIRLTVDAPVEGVVCAHDPATLEQALVAMVVNAIEASPLGGSVVLKAERIEAERGRGGEGETEARGRNVCRISVHDQGPGLPVDNPERIFEFSYSTKQRGMGLGLALARLALERQGGKAHACNRAAGGAMVFVDLPSADGEQNTTGELRTEH